MRRGLNLVTPPKGVKVAGDDNYWRHPQDPMDEPTPYIPGVQRGPTEWERQNPDKLRPDDDEQMPDDELERRQSEWDAEHGMADFQSRVEEDRANRGEMSPEEFDEWDMQWRARGKEAGLDEQEVDAFMDSIWEGEGSEPAGFYD
ncbi:MAG: hypothetical protein E6Q97_32670 [Desulfurellales bacterium]|nr:MAG: hypothetical protein E6Q97_32670 [Desulfurellales bacterium]